MDEDKRQQGSEPLKIEIEYEKEKTKAGTKERTQVKFGVEDIIAIFAGVVAIILALGMVFGRIPVNELTVGVLTFSGVGGAIAEIIAARKRKQKEN